MYSFFCPGCKIHHVVYIEERYIGSHGRRKWNRDLVKPILDRSMRVQFRQEDVMCHVTITDSNIHYHEDCTHGYRNKDIEMKEV
jgi:hypothetical protein